MVRCLGLTPDRSHTIIFASNKTLIIVSRITRTALGSLDLAGGESTVTKSVIHLGCCKTRRCNAQQPVDFARFSDVCSDELVLSCLLFGNGACACSDMCAQSRAVAAVVRSRCAKRLFVGKFLK